MIEDLFTHTLTRYRAAEAKSTGQTVSRTWSAATGIPGEVQVLSEATQDDGGGERTVGQYKVFAGVSADILEGDIVKVTAGPGASGFPYLWVDSVYLPRENHLQARAHSTREDPTT